MTISPSFANNISILLATTTLQKKSCFLKNITTAGNFIYMGYKIELDAMVFSIWTNGDFGKYTIRR